MTRWKVRLCGAAVVAALSSCSSSTTTTATAPPESTPTTTTAVALSTTTTAPATQPVAGPTIELLAPGVAIPTQRVPVDARPAVAEVGQPRSIVFETPTRGWLLGAGTIGGPVPLDATTDGGSTWHRVASPVEAAAANTLFELRSGRVGELWLIGHSSRFHPGVVFVTTDNGKSWYRVKGLGRVRDLIARPAGTWAVTDDCNLMTFRCVSSVVETTDSGASWRSLASPDSLGHTGDFAQLIRGDDKRAWLLTSRDVDFGWELVTTQDGGRSWTALTTPPQCQTLNAGVAVLDAQNLWVACGGNNATIMQRRVNARSNDGGRSWQVNFDKIVVGHFAGLTVLSQDVAFVGQGRATAIVTRDGGSTWDRIEDFHNGVDGGVYPIVFFDRNNGWAADRLPDGGVVAWRTTNGGQTWRPSLPLP